MSLDLSMGEIMRYGLLVFTVGFVHADGRASPLAAVQVSQVRRAENSVVIEAWPTSVPKVTEAAVIEVHLFLNGTLLNVAEPTGDIVGDAESFLYEWTGGIMEFALNEEAQRLNRLYLPGEL